MHTYASSHSLDLTDPEIQKLFSQLQARELEGNAPAPTPGDRAPTPVTSLMTRRLLCPELRVHSDTETQRVLAGVPHLLRLHAGMSLDIVASSPYRST